MFFTFIQDINSSQIQQLHLQLHLRQHFFNSIELSSGLLENILQGHPPHTQPSTITTLNVINSCSFHTQASAFLSAGTSTRQRTTFCIIQGKEKPTIICYVVQDNTSITWYHRLMDCNPSPKHQNLNTWTQSTPNKARTIICYFCYNKLLIPTNKDKTT